MSFGQQAGPPASEKQIAYLRSLLKGAGYADFADARLPLGLTSKQVRGRFTSREASALIDQLLNPADGTDTAEIDTAKTSADEPSTSPALEPGRRRLLAGLSDEVLVEELRRRGYTVVHR